MSSPSSAPASPPVRALTHHRRPRWQLWFTEYGGNRIGRITPSGVVTEFSTGITAGATRRHHGRPRRQPVVHGAWRQPDRADHTAPASSPSSAPASRAGARPVGITAGPDGNLWFTEIRRQPDRTDYPAGVVTEFSAGISPGAHLTTSRPGPTATCGSPKFAAAGSAGLPRSASSPSSAPASPRRSACRHHGRPRWQPVVHGSIRQPDRPDHHGGRRHRVQHRHHRRQHLLTASRPAPTATCGSPNRTATAIGRDHRRPASSPSSAPASPPARSHGITAGPDGNLWFTETRRPDRADHARRRRHRVQPGITAGSCPYGITAGPDGNLWFTESGRQPDRPDHPAGVVTEFSAGISPAAGPIGITAGPDGNLWFTEPDGDRIGRITPAGRRHRVQRRHRRRQRPTASRPAPTATSGSPKLGGSRIGRITPPASSPSSHRHHPGAARRDHGRARRQPLVHRAVGEPDRPDHPERRRHRVQRRHHRRRGSPASRPGPTATCGSPRIAGNRIGRITPPGVVTEFTRASRPAAPDGITAGPDGNLWFTEIDGNRVGRITTSSVVAPTARLLVPDGTSEQQAFTSYPEARWFALRVEPGRTYVIEAADVAGELMANAIGTLNIFAPDGSSAPPEASLDCGNGPRPPAVDVYGDGLRWCCGPDCRRRGCSRTSGLSTSG